MARRTRSLKQVGLRGRPGQEAGIARDVGSTAEERGAVAFPLDRVGARCFDAEVDGTHARVKVDIAAS